ncbi:MAG: lysoplasmalogenase [Dehalococcoidia bacterium]|nr:lysoplasmalogenase [Dehalococcoidia bacterium]
MNRMTPLHRGLLYISIAFSAIYLVSLTAAPYPGQFAVKAVPAVLLAILALKAVRGLVGKLLFTALLFCAAGDVALALDGEQFFVTGLLFFLIAQVLFIVTFSRDLRKRRSRLPIIIILVVYAAIMAAVLRPVLGDLMIPVFFYIAVITTMGVLAALRAAESKLVLYGALSFIISDSLIAINEFAVSLPASGYIIMATYYSALFLITTGYPKDEGK